MPPLPLWTIIPVLPGLCKCLCSFRSFISLLESPTWWVLFFVSLPYSKFWYPPSGFVPTPNTKTRPDLLDKKILNELFFSFLILFWFGSQKNQWLGKQSNKYDVDLKAVRLGNKTASPLHHSYIFFISPSPLRSTLVLIEYTDSSIPF